jgi:hypothetical protein
MKPSGDCHYVFIGRRVIEGALTFGKNILRRKRGSRYGHRDATAILIAYRHGLRVSAKPR